MKYVKESVRYWCEDTSLRKYTGKGIGVAVMDTGIVPHPDFGNRIKAFKDCVNNRIAMYDDSGHGTHVAGILGGSGKMSGGFYEGMASEAHFIIMKVLDSEGEGAVPVITQGVQWLLENYKKYAVRIVNISVGAKPDLEEEKGRALIQAVDSLWDAGLIVVVSAGNYGPEQGTIAAPGTSKKLITAGSSDLPVSSTKSHVYYSGCGPTQECVIKPDVVAPGYRIMSCNGMFYKKGQEPYIVKSGSSMSTPVVSGAIALLLSKYPHMTNVEVKLKLRECSDRIDVPRHMQGWGRINVAKLLKNESS